MTFWFVSRPMALFSALTALVNWPASANAAANVSTKSTLARLVKETAFSARVIAAFPSLTSVLGLVANIQAVLFNAIESRDPASLRCHFKASASSLGTPSPVL